MGARITMKGITTYQEAEQYILSIPKFTSKNTSEDTAAFYQRLGEPGSASRLIHIAGTNGKGSVCAYLSGILEEAGKTVGMFTSPHLVSMRERFRLQGEMAGEEDFLNAFSQVMEAVEDWDRKEYHPTFFEILFFMGMLIFEDKKPEFILLETGLGGRLDATNVITQPDLTIITKISMDHMQYLGNTIAEIAGEKAGILKRGVPVLFPEQSRSAMDVIKQKAGELHCRQLELLSKNINILHIGNKNIDFSLKSSYYDYISLTLSTCALYQVQNAALAVCAAEELDGGRTITGQQIKNAVQRTRWEGRMEEIMPEIYVDGAHNQDGAEAFMESVKATGKTDNHILFAVVNDKDYRSLIHTLMREGLFTRITITKVEGDRAVAPICLRNIFTEYVEDKDIHIFEDAEMAFYESIRAKGENNRLYIVGSLYLVGFVKGLSQKRRRGVQ